MDSSILDTFNQYFELVPALSGELKNEVYKLRFQVYCNETKFEESSLYPEGLEYDTFDNNSIHYLIRHRKSNIYAATTRLILPDSQDPKKLFPLEVHSVIDNPGPLNDIPRNQLAEVSRFCVSKEFKRRKHEEGSLTGININTVNSTTEGERRVFPHITIALIAGLIRISEENEIHYWYAVMEPALLRFLSTLGIKFTGIGPVIDYHGKRKPGVIKVIDLLNGVLEKNPSLWVMLTENGRFGAGF